MTMSANTHAYRYPLSKSGTKTGKLLYVEKIYNYYVEKIYNYYVCIYKYIECTAGYVSLITDVLIMACGEMITDARYNN